MSTRGRGPDARTRRARTRRAGAGGNLFAPGPARRRRELVQVLARTRAIRVERIVSRGHRTPAGRWYDQPTAEWVAVLRGRAGLRFADEDRARVLGAGDWIAIAPHRRHRVEWTDPARATVWLAIHHRAEGGMADRRRARSRRPA